MFRDRTPQESVEAFGASMRTFHPAGFRAMANASAENLRDVLPHIELPTLLICGAEDVRAPLPVARDLEASIPASTLVVPPGVGHVCNLEAPKEFNAVVRSFLLSTLNQ
jgi:pimeloyl-ACP methyl ester carboxylesterase